MRGYVDNFGTIPVMCTADFGQCGFSFSGKTAVCHVPEMQWLYFIWPGFAFLLASRHCSGLPYLFHFVPWVEEVFLHACSEKSICS